MRITGCAESQVFSAAVSGMDGSGGLDARLNVMWAHSKAMAAGVKRHHSFLNFLLQVLT